MEKSYECDRTLRGRTDPRTGDSPVEGNMIRGALYTTGFAAPCWALLASFWSLTAFLVLMLVGMVAVTAAGYLEHQQ
jgi:hypothetical protein